MVVILTGLRAATMEYVLAPFAKHMGLPKKKEVTRFSEQAWLVMYCVVFWSLGFVCACPLPLVVDNLIAARVGNENVADPDIHAVSLLHFSSVAEHERTMD